MELQQNNQPNPTPQQLPQPKKWYQNKGVIAITVLVIIACAVSYFALSKNPQDKKANPTTNQQKSSAQSTPSSPVPTNIPSGWKTLTNKNGWQISYPPSWMIGSIDETTPLESVDFAVNFTTLQTNVQVNDDQIKVTSYTVDGKQVSANEVPSRNAFVSIRAFSAKDFDYGMEGCKNTPKECFDSYNNFYSTLVNISDPIETTFHDLAAMQFKQSAVNSPLPKTVVLVRSGNKMYHITYQEYLFSPTSPSTLAPDLQLLQPVLDTISFIK